MGMTTGLVLYLSLCESNGSVRVCARMCTHALRSRGDNKTWGIGHGCLQTGDK